MPIIIITLSSDFVFKSEENYPALNGAHIGQHMTQLWHHSAKFTTKLMQSSTTKVVVNSAFASEE
jgi:hypothetical protein